MSKYEGTLLTLDELKEKLESIPDDSAILMLTRNGNCRTIYIAPTINHLREKLDITRKKGEFGDTIGVIDEALAEGS